MYYLSRDYRERMNKLISVGENIARPVGTIGERIIRLPVKRYRIVRANTVWDTNGARTLIRTGTPENGHGTDV